MQRILVISLMLMATLPPAALGQAVRSKAALNSRGEVSNEHGEIAAWQTGRTARQQITPLIDTG